MKRLFLLRHAQALPAEDGSDIDRRLSERGLSDAYALGETLKAQGLLPDRILCSAAKRTQQTCAELLKGSASDIPTEFTRDIYSASFGALFSMVQNLDNAAESVMIIGHNPTIYELAVKLSADGDDTTLNHLSLGYSPASLSIIESDIDHWAKLDPNDCRITALLTAAHYNASAQ